MNKTKLQITLITTVIAFTITLSGHTQTFSISGKITDGIYPIQYANVAMFDKDSNLINGTISSHQGQFSLEGLNKGEAILHVSFIGYSTKYINVYIHEPANDLGIIILEPDLLNLNEVTVSGTNPTFVIKGGALITNVKNSLLSSIGNGFDVIENIPGINVQEEEITVFGRGKPIVYINNKRVFDKTEIEQLSSTDISTIELLNNPGAKYDAEGRAVLIIKTKKKAFNGLSFIVKEQIRYGQYFNNTENINLSYTRDNISLFTSYYQTNKKTISESHAVNKLKTDTLWKQEINLPFKLQYKIHIFTVGFDWSFAPRHSIGIQYKGYLNDSEYDITGNTSVVANERSYDKINVNSLKTESPDKHFFNAFYKANISDKFNSQLDFDYLKNHIKFEQHVEEKSQLNGTRVINIDGQSDFELFATKLVNNYKISNNTELEFGGEYNNIKGNGYLLNTEKNLKSNIYANSEEKIALFGGINKTLDNWNFNFGVRYERANETLTEDSIAHNVIDREYSDLFPFLSISKEYENIRFSLSANKRIKRPSFSQLNSNNAYINRFMIERGNPLLDKELIYDINYQMIYRIFSLNLGYTYIKNPISKGLEYEPESKFTYLTFMNHEKYQNVNCMITANYKLDWWHPRITVKVLQPFFTVDGINGTQEYNIMNFAVDFYNQFELPKNYIFTTYFNYQNEHNYYLERWKEVFCLDLSLRKSFFNDRLDAKLEFQDVFDWNKINVITQIDNHFLEMNNKRETKYVLLTIKYKFNNYKKRYRGKNAAPDDINRL